MDARLIALKLLLDELGVDGRIDTVDDRKRIQKAIYLGQRVGVDLGYRFSWYLRGPYSSRLANDYYGLAELLSAGDESYKDRTLRSALRDRLRKIRPLMQPPSDVGLSQEDWLELLASYDYLRRVLRCSPAAATKVMTEKKPHVAEHCALAETTLQKGGLLS